MVINNGVLVCWGMTLTAAATTINLPISYVTGQYAVLLIDLASSNAGVDLVAVGGGQYDKTINSFVVLSQNINRNSQVYWMTIGY